MSVSEPVEERPRPSSTSSLPGQRRLTKVRLVPRAASGYFPAPSTQTPSSGRHVGYLSMDASPASSSPPSPTPRLILTALDSGTGSTSSSGSLTTMHSSYGLLRNDSTSSLNIIGSPIRHTNDSPLTVDELAYALHPKLPSQGENMPSENDLPELLLLDTRNFLVFAKSHIRGSHNINIPPMIVKRFLRALESPGTSKPALSNIFSSPEGRAAFEQRADKTVVLIDDNDSSKACKILLSILKADELIADVCRLEGGYAEFEKRYAELCDYLSPSQQLQQQLTHQEHHQQLQLQSFHQHQDSSSSSDMSPNLAMPQQLTNDQLMALTNPGRPVLSNPAMASEALDTGSTAAHSSMMMRGRNLHVSIGAAASQNADLSDQRYVPPSEVFPWLHMGSEEDAANVDLLRRLNVRYVVNAARECKNHHEEIFVYKNLAADDKIDEDSVFEEQVKEVCKFIADVKTRNDGAVFVHCRAGISRSATVVIAFLQMFEGYRYEDALNYVRLRRPCVNPNLGFLCMLMQLPAHGTP